MKTTRTGLGQASDEKYKMYLQKWMILHAYIHLYLSYLENTKTKA